MATKTAAKTSTKTAKTPTVSKSVSKPVSKPVTLSSATKNSISKAVTNAQKSNVDFSKIQTFGNTYKPTTANDIAKSLATASKPPSVGYTTQGTNTRYGSDDAKYGGHTTPDGDWVPATGIKATNAVDAQAEVNAPKPPPVPEAPAFDQAAYTQQLQSGVNDIYNKQKEAQLTQLYASRDKAVGQLNQQKAEVAPQYADKRNQSDVVSAQNVQRLRELMGNSGLTSSGENVTASVGLQNARQSALNGLNLQEQQNTNDINRQINDLNNPASEQALVAALEAQRSQALYGAGRDAVADNQWQSQFDFSKNVDSRNFNYQQYQDAIQKAMNEAGLTGKYNGQDTLAALDAARNFALNQAGVTGKYNGQNTMANNQLIAQLTGQYNGKNTYQAQQDAINNALNISNVTGKYNGQSTLAAQQLAEQKAQFKTTQAWQEHVFNNLSAADQAQLKQALTIFDKTQLYDYYALKSKQETALAQNQAQIDAYSGSALNLIP